MNDHFPPDGPQTARVHRSPGGQAVSGPSEKAGYDALRHAMEILGPSVAQVPQGLTQALTGAPGSHDAL